MTATKPHASHEDKMAQPLSSVTLHAVGSPVRPPDDLSPSRGLIVSIAVSVLLWVALIGTIYALVF